jgi:transposase
MQIHDQQWDMIRKHFPEETPIPGKPGPKPTPAREILEAVLWILNTGAQWAELPQKFPPYQTVHRRFQAWCRDDTLCDILYDLANQLRERGVIDERESFIDAMFSPAKGGGDGVGKTKRGKGCKIMAIVDSQGLPLAISTHAANHHEVTLVQLTFNFYMIEAMPEKLIGDRAYDSDPLDEELAQDGIDMVAPHRKNRRKARTQDGRTLRRYARRWIVERFFAWVQWRRRILIRWEYHMDNFLGFVRLAAAFILLRRI